MTDETLSNLSREDRRFEPPADLAGALAWKYCGGGFGGYAVYLFAEPAQRDAACQRKGFHPVEPYVAGR